MATNIVPMAKPIFIGRSKKVKFCIACETNGYSHLRLLKNIALKRNCVYKDIMTVLDVSFPRDLSNLYICESCLLLIKKVCRLRHQCQENVKYLSNESIDKQQIVGSVLPKSKPCMSIQQMLNKPLLSEHGRVNVEEDTTAGITESFSKSDTRGLLNKHERVTVDKDHTSDDIEGSSKSDTSGLLHVSEHERVTVDMDNTSSDDIDGSSKSDTSGLLHVSEHERVTVENNNTSDDIEGSSKSDTSGLIHVSEHERVTVENNNTSDDIEGSSKSDTSGLIHVSEHERVTVENNNSSDDIEGSSKSDTIGLIHVTEHERVTVENNNSSDDIEGSSKSDTSGLLHVSEHERVTVDGNNTGGNTNESSESETVRVNSTHQNIKNRRRKLPVTLIANPSGKEKPKEMMSSFEHSYASGHNELSVDQLFECHHFLFMNKPSDNCIEKVKSVLETNDNLDNDTLIGKLLSNPEINERFWKTFLLQMNTELEVLCGTKSPSVLRKNFTDVSPSSLLESIYKEMDGRAPKVFDTLVCLCTPIYMKRTLSNHVVPVMYSMAQHSRNNHLNALQKQVTAACTKYGAGNGVFDILCSLGICAGDRKKLPPFDESSELNNLDNMLSMDQIFQSHQYLSMNTPDSDCIEKVKSILETISSHDNDTFMEKLLSDPDIYERVRKKFLLQINTEMDMLCRTKSPSTLRKNVTEVNPSTLLENVYREMDRNAPKIFQVLVCLCTPIHMPPILSNHAVAAIYCLAQNSRNHQMNALQKHVAAACIKYGGGPRLFDVLFSLGLCLSRKMNLSSLDQWIKLQQPEKDKNRLGNEHGYSFASNEKKLKSASEKSKGKINKKKKKSKEQDMKSGQTENSIKLSQENPPVMKDVLESGANECIDHTREVPVGAVDSDPIIMNVSESGTNECNVHTVEVQEETVDTDPSRTDVWEDEANDSIVQHLKVEVLETVDTDPLVQDHDNSFVTGRDDEVVKAVKMIVTDSTESPVSTETTEITGKDDITLQKTVFQQKDVLVPGDHQPSSLSMITNKLQKHILNKNELKSNSNNKTTGKRGAAVSKSTRCSVKSGEIKKFKSKRTKATNSPFKNGINLDDIDHTVQVPHGSEKIDALVQDFSDSPVPCGVEVVGAEMMVASEVVKPPPRPEPNGFLLVPGNVQPNIFFPINFIMKPNMLSVAPLSTSDKKKTSNNKRKKGPVKSGEVKKRKRTPKKTSTKQAEKANTDLTQGATQK